MVLIRDIYESRFKVSFKEIFAGNYEKYQQFGNNKCCIWNAEEIYIMETESWFRTINLHFFKTVFLLDPSLLAFKQGKNLSYEVKNFSIIQNILRLPIQYILNKAILEINKPKDGFYKENILQLKVSICV